MSAPSDMSSESENRLERYVSTPVMRRRSFPQSPSTRSQSSFGSHVPLRKPRVAFAPYAEYRYIKAKKSHGRKKTLTRIAYVLTICLALVIAIVHIV